MIRILTLTMCLVFGVSAFAQDKKNVPAKEEAKTEAPEREATRDDMIADGLILGLSYENLDSRATVKYKDSDSTYLFKSEKNLGFAGTRLGYGVMPVSGFGYNGILTIEKSSKKDDAGQSYMIYKGEGNVSYGFSLTEQIGMYGFIGLHLADLDPSGTAVAFGLGGQLGLGLSFTANWAIELGFTGTVHNFKDSFFDANPDVDKDGTYYSNGGWLAHLNYNF